MFLNTIILDIDNVLVALIYILACFVLFALGKYSYQVVRKGIDVDYELVEKDNLAFAISQVGYYVGLLLVIGSTLVGDSLGLVNDLIQIFKYGVIGIVLLNIALVINDKLVLPKFKVRKEIIEDQNAGTGIIEGALAAGSGLLLFGAFSVEEQFLPFSLLYFLIGQLLFIVTAKVYNLITPYDIHKQIENDNVAVGVGMAGALLAIANLIRFAVGNEFQEWEEYAIIILFDGLIGLLMLPAVRFLVDKLLLPKRKLTDEIVNQDRPNVGAAFIEAFAYIGGSILITWCL